MADWQIVTVPWRRGIYKQNKRDPSVLVGSAQRSDLANEANI